MNEEYPFTRGFLWLLGIIVAILGAVFIYNMLTGIDTFNKYIDDYFGSNQGYNNNGSLISTFSEFLSNQGYNNNGSESLLSNIKTGIWIYIFDIIIFWISLISLLPLISSILGDNDSFMNEILVRLLGIIIIIFSIVTFVFYLSQTEYLKSVEWINNFRLEIGFLFLLFNCLHGFICIAAANIHKKNASSVQIPHFDLSDRLSNKSDLNTSKESKLFCSNCGHVYLSNQDITYCPECGDKL
jgi:hypothetical protein